MVSRTADAPPRREREPLLPGMRRGAPTPHAGDRSMSEPTEARCPLCQNLVPFSSLICPDCSDTGLYFVTWVIGLVVAFVLGFVAAVLFWWR